MKTASIGSSALGLAAYLAAPAEAFWRMPCPGRLVLERIDPIVSPGEVAGHVHTVSGGSGFGFNTSFDQLRESSCSSCPIKQDMSAYWTPKLYYQNQDGSFEDVPQVGEGPGTTAGTTVYYLQRGAPADKLLPFPKDFRMLAGLPEQRSSTGLQAAPGDAVSFVCLDYNGPASPQTNHLPDKNCPNGVRAQVFFPSCWDGVNVDSEDHRSHMAYPIGHYDSGVCPPSHPKQLISIFFEVMYDTGKFSDRWYNGKNPFVFSNGDPTGYGFHGDFINGWDIDVLSKAIKECTADSGRLEDCHVFGDDLFTGDECQACQIPPSVDEQLTGKLDVLPGCNPVTKGPAAATKVAGCPKASIGQPATYFTDMTKSMDWKYVGCAKDDIASRTFQADFTWSADMTVKKCIEYCKGKGYSMAGLEFANQCYCDNKYHSTGANDVREPQKGVLGNCRQPCAGDAKEICGSGGALSVYQSCGGKDCSNDLYSVVGNGTAPTTNEPTRKPVDTPAQTPSHTAQKPVETPVQKPSQHTAQKPVETPVQKPSQHTAQKPVETPVHKPSAYTPVQKPSQHTAQKPAETPVHKPSQHTSAQKPVDTPVQKPSKYNSVQKPVETTVQKPSEYTSAQKPTETSAQETSQTSSDSPVETASESCTDSSVQEPTQSSTAVDTPAQTSSVSPAQTSSVSPASNSSVSPSQEPTESSTQAATTESSAYPTAMPVSETTSCDESKATATKAPSKYRKGHSHGHRHGHGYRHGDW